MVGGLWAGDTSLTQDFATVVWRLKLLGFNAVRLPFSFQVCTASAWLFQTFPPGCAYLAVNYRKRRIAQAIVYLCCTILSVYITLSSPCVSRGCQ